MLHGVILTKTRQGSKADEKEGSRQAKGEEVSKTPNAAAQRRFENLQVRFVWINRGLAWTRRK
jgi:hypothetical protein